MSGRSWSTQDEKGFLHGLGSHTTHLSSKLELLRRYRDAKALRHIWGTMSKSAIAEFVDELIAQEERRLAA